MDSELKIEPRNTQLGEFWFGRMLCLLAVFFVFGGTAGAFAVGVTGADAVQLLKEAFWVLLALALIYNGRAWAHDRLVDVVTAIRGR